MTNHPLRPLVEILLACPARDERFSRKSLIATWDCLKQTDLENGDELTPSILAALVLCDETVFAQLLNAAEHAQLTVLARTALQRFQEKSNPPHPLGSTLAATVKGGL